MIFIDASALVSILVDEADADELTDRLELDPVRLCSAISIWETVSALSHSHKYKPGKARADVTDFLRNFGLSYVPIDEREAELAVAAYEKFGKGRHKAALNIGDCFAYACTKANGAKLLFKGGDFALTDIAAA
jgi:ribonuclease VapC